MSTVHSWKSLENPAVPSWLEHGTCSDPLLQPCRARQAHPLDASPVLGDNWDTVVAEQVPQIPVPVPWAQLPGWYSNRALGWSWANKPSVAELQTAGFGWP